VNLRNRRAVLIALAAGTVVLFVTGMLAAFLSRHESICPDGKVPVAKRSDLLGQTEYRCQDGRIVTK
jgi:hypothetical protein